MVGEAALRGWTAIRGYEILALFLRLIDGLSMYLTRIDPDANMRRYYQIDLAADLFGGVMMVRHWGRIGTTGQQRQQWFPDFDGAEQARQIQATRKLRKGYAHSG